MPDIAQSRCSTLWHQRLKSAAISTPKVPPSPEMKTDEQLETQETLESIDIENTTMQHQAIQIVGKLFQAEEMILKGWRLVVTLSAEKAVVEKNGVRMEPVSVHR
jgi:hypothetical protein